MRRDWITIVLSLTMLGTLGAGNAFAHHAAWHTCEVDPNQPGCVTGVETDGGVGVGGVSGSAGGSGGSGETQPTGSGGQSGPSFEFRYVLDCSGNGAGDASCVGAVTTCPNPGELRFLVFRRPVTPADAQWELVGTQCRAPASIPPAQQVPPPVDGLVRRAFEAILLPKVAAQVQPAGTTPVNFDTIWHAEVYRSHDYPVTLLGQSVVIRATPTGFTWHFGDGATTSTTTPGAPYPSKEITHRYATPGAKSAYVTVTYRGEFAVNGGGFRQIPGGGVDVDGPPTEIQAREYAAVLVAGH